MDVPTLTTAESRRQCKEFENDTFQIPSPERPGSPFLDTIVGAAPQYAAVEGPSLRLAVRQFPAGQPRLPGNLFSVTDIQLPVNSPHQGSKCNLFTRWALVRIFLTLGRR